MRQGDWVDRNSRNYSSTRNRCLQL